MIGAGQRAVLLTGLACLIVAIVPPLDAAAHVRLSAHMGQYILLSTLAPALLIHGGTRLPVPRGFLGHPLFALLVSSGVLWSWHLPWLHELALRVPLLHLIEQSSFFTAGLLFWYPVVKPSSSRTRWPRGAMIPYLLAADVQNTVFAAVLTFSDRVLYPSYAAAALSDQVLAGVIMWVPMSLAYLVPAALLTVQLLSPHANGGEAPYRAPRIELPH